MNSNNSTPEYLFSPISESSVKKYVIFKLDNENLTDNSTQQSFERWVVVGSDKTYFVQDDFCTCYSFILDNLKKINQCKHIKLLHVAKQSKNYDTFLISFSEYEKFREEWVT